MIKKFGIILITTLALTVSSHSSSDGELLLKKNEPPKEVNWSHMHDEFIEQLKTLTRFKEAVVDEVAKRRIAKNNPFFGRGLIRTLSQLEQFLARLSPIINEEPTSTSVRKLRHDTENFLNQLSAEIERADRTEKLTLDASLYNLNKQIEVIRQIVRKRQF